MVQILTTSGPVVVNDEIISRVINRTSDYPYTHVWGPAPAGPLETAEDAATLVGRLHLGVPLARLAAPAGAPIWLKGSAVSLLRPATAFEHGVAAPFVNSVAIVAGRVQAMSDMFEQAYAILVQAGANLPAMPAGRVADYDAHVAIPPQVFELW